MLFLTSTAYFLLPALASALSASPTANTRNGTLSGSFLPTFSQDAFLGIPYAVSPTGDLRFQQSVSYNESWTGTRDATEYSLTCIGYGDLDIGLTQGEDCLSLNVVRPSGTSEGDGLPVMVWIYGGGFVSGGSADPRYNLSYIVNASTAIEKPIIGVSINYRVNGWGFLASQEVLDAGVANMGLFDQRLALRWIQENIAAFGGNPEKVTIWGESAGGFSVGFQMIGFDGQNEGLFRAVIMESGNALGQTVTPASTYQDMYDDVAAAVGCSNATDTLQCLRTVPWQALNETFQNQVYTPIIDGTFLTRLPSESYEKGLVADVAVLAGTNTDEGTASYFGPRGTLNTTEDVEALLSGLGLPSEAVQTALELYPDDPAVGCPYGTGSERFASQGWMYKRGASIVADYYLIAGRRQTAQYHSSNSTHSPVYSYRFDTAPWNGIMQAVETVQPVYVTHFTEIAFVFNNFSPDLPNYIGPYESYHALSNFVARSWVSFAHDLDPNNHGISGAPQWPDYSSGAENIVFRANGSYVEKDDWRAPQLEFWTKWWKEISV